MADPDIYGDLCADLPSSAPTAPAVPAVPAPAATVRDAPPPQAPFRARNLVWKPPPETVQTAKAAETTETTQAEVIDLESVEELQVLNTRSFVPPPVPSAGSAPTTSEPTESAAAGPVTVQAVARGVSFDDKDAANSHLPGQNHPEFIAVERSRGRNLGEDGKEAGTQASQDPDELKVLNASAASMPEGMDIYGDLCSDLPRTASLGSKAFRRPRARNLVWKAENPSRPKVKEPKDGPKAVAVDAWDEALDAAPLQTQQQEAALQKVLAEEVQEPAAPDGLESPVPEEVEDSDDESGAVHLGEVLASQTALRAPAGAPANAVSGSRWSAPVPVVPCLQRPAEGFLLLAGIPAWLTDSELRKHASQFGQVRSLRTLSDSKGKSVGILLLEYSDIQSVRRATEADGICRIRMLQGFGIVPRSMLVNSELHATLCRADAGAPWPDGGSCGEELRQKLLDVFGMQPVGSKKRSRAEEAANLTEEIKKLKGVPLASIPAREAKAKGGEDWANKLKTLKGAVHPEAKDGAVCPAAMAQPVVNSPETGWAQKLKKLKGAVNSGR